MKQREVYNTWKEKNSQIDIRANFADEVMNQVYRYEQKKAKPWFDMQWFFEFVSTNSLAKLALVISSGLLGLARIVFIVCVFLRP